MKLTRALAVHVGLLLTTACAQAQTEAPGAQRPLVFNSPASVKPGDVVGLQGAFFGTSPVVTLRGPGPSGDVNLPLTNRHGSAWLSFKIPPGAQAALQVRVSNGLASSEWLSLNAARADHLDALLVAPGGAFKVFGRNLLTPGFSPSLTVDGMAATVDLQQSDEHMLVAKAPLGLRPNTMATISVDNGNGTGASALDRRISVVPGGMDVFGLGVGWGAGFERIASRVLTLGPDNKVACNGQGDDSAGVQAAIDLLAGSGGGVVRLPAGVCRFVNSVKLKSRVVLQGRGKDETTIRYESSYPLWGRKLDLVGVTDLTLQNTRAGLESLLLQDTTRAFFKNLRMEMEGGLQMFLTGNTNFVVMDSDIHQPPNAGKNGVYHMADAAGLVFVNNTTRFTHGAPAFPRAQYAWISNNLFVRDARPVTMPNEVVHSMTLDFAHRVAVMGNRFEVLGAPITNKFRNDGETLLSEGGGGKRSENTGMVSSATSDSLSDPKLAAARHRDAAGLLPQNLAVAIVGGTGAGQSRRIRAIEGTTLQVDPPWDQLPDSTSRYATFVWGLEKVVIKGNVLKNNPRGIWLYQTAVRDVDIVGNRIFEGGGIYLRSAQNLKNQLFTPMYGVRIADNQISNTTGEWRSYISLIFVRMDEDDFGVATTGIEVRNNQLAANLPNLSQPQDEAGGGEGLFIRMHTEGPTQSLSKNQMRLQGTIFQDNHCSGCNSSVIVREGAVGTVLVGNTVNTTEKRE